MRSEQNIRDELAQTIAEYEQLESKDTLYARALHEKIRWLEWTLQASETPQGNGTPEAE